MAARESGKAPEKAMDGLLRQTLQHAAPPPDPCPGPETLAAYFERTLDDREIAEYEVHLSRCALCREQQAAMARAHAPARVIEDEKPRWAWLWDWRWLAPVTAVLVLAAVWYARRPEMTGGKSAELPYLAMSRSAEEPTGVLSEGKRVLTPSANDALRKIEREDNGAAAAAGNTQTKKQAQDLASRQAENELASNLEPGTPEKDSGAPSRDMPSVTSAEAPPASVPPPAPSPNNAAPDVASSRADAQAAPKAKPTITDALAGRNSNLAAAQQRFPETLVRTPNPQVLWRIGAAGTVERSTDAGATWLGQLPDAGAQVTAGSAPAEKVCWLVGRDGLIQLTTDAADWKKIPPPVKTDFASVVATDSLNATVTATDGRKFTTADGGAHWTPAP